MARCAVKPWRRVLLLIAPSARGTPARPCVTLRRARPRRCPGGTLNSRVPESGPRGLLPPDHVHSEPPGGPISSRTGVRPFRAPGPAGEGWTGLPAGGALDGVSGPGTARGRPVRDGVTDILHPRYRADAPAAYGCSPVPDGPPGDGAGPATTSLRHAGEGHSTQSGHPGCRGHPCSHRFTPSGVDSHAT